MDRRRQRPRRRRLDGDDHGPPRRGKLDHLDNTDLECPRDPEPVDATALQVGPGDEENYSDDSESSAEEEEVGE